MRKKDKQTVTIRNHLSPFARTRKAVMGLVLLPLSFYLLFGIKLEQDNPWLFVGLLLVAFLAFGMGWVGASQGLMGWSRQVEFDFARNEVRQISASILGRSKPFIVPFFKIADFRVKEGPVKGEGGLGAEAMIELRDRDGGVMIRAGMFDTSAEAEAMVTRINDAIAMAYQQQQAEQSVEAE